LRPVHAGTPLQKERGRWVFQGGKPLSFNEANQLRATFASNETVRTPVSAAGEGIL
jgi:hypothetical protein